MRNSFEVYADHKYGMTNHFPEPLSNTTIGVVATSVDINKSQAHKLADIAHDGIALAIRPAHMLHDGDAMFALSTGVLNAPDEFPRICAVAPIVVAEAIKNAIKFAKSLDGISSWEQRNE